MSNRSRADKKGNKPKLSPEAKTQAQVITDRVVPVSFTKQQRKEVQQAIESGMETIRSQAKSNNRERDKKLKKLQALLDNKNEAPKDRTEEKPTKFPLSVIVPWVLVLLSWLGFIAYISQLSK